MEIITMLCAFVIAVLSGMGVGSAGLLVVYLTLICQVPQLEAQGLNLAFFLISSATALLCHLPRRHIPFWPVLLLTFSGILGVLPGSYLAQTLETATVRRLFAVMLILSGSSALFRRSEKNPSKST